jgi:hypothetical protein
VSSYEIPANASQPRVTQVLDTSDARNTQAVQAEDPSRGKFAFWTQHTIKSGTFSVVRWYEIDPVPATPVVLHFGSAGVTAAFAFNGAISPDRAFNNGHGTFGNRFVIEFNSSNKFTEPNIMAASGINGTVDSFLLVEAGVAPYIDSGSCPNGGDKCRWGDYSGASPDPTPVFLTRTRGMVWGTNQFAGVSGTIPIFGAEWRTRIFALEP